MHISFDLQHRLAQAKLACVERMQDTAAWLLAADLTERQALQQCGHRLIGTLGSYGFEEAAALAAALVRSCDKGIEEIEAAVAALAAALRSLPR